MRLVQFLLIYLSKLNINNNRLLRMNQQVSSSQSSSSSHENKKQKKQQQPSKLISCLFSNKQYFIITNRTAKNISRALALFFAILAIVTFLFAKDIKKIAVPYSVMRNCFVDNPHKMKFGKVCEVDFQVNETIKGPVFMTYYIENIYINHKKYLKSFSKDQLMGKTISEKQAIQQCYPIVYNSDLFWNTSWGGQPLDPEGIASPCGLKPMLFFNDTYKIKSQSGQFLKIKETEILKQDPGYQPQPQSEKYQWIDPSGQHFESYMQDRSLMTKKRLWGIIDNDLQKGKYTMIANNSYQINTLQIIKGIELTNSSMLGSIPYFFPIAFGIAALISLGYSIFLAVRLNVLEQYIETSLKESYQL